jgi:TRAP-type mannitol/chloroaromatic compound transport system substrate-binding protein
MSAEPRNTADRRRFLTAAGVAIAATAAAAGAPAVIAQPRVQWRMSTSFTAAFDIVHGVAQRLARAVGEMSGGRFRIEVFPGGQIMQPFECFEAASQGKVEAFMGSPQYWNDKEAAIEWFSTIPFGMNPQGMTAWYHQGDGRALWDAAYAGFNLVARPALCNGPQMAGWFRKKITAIGDFKGLKMRIPNLGGKVYGRAGATTVVTPLAEVYAALERGVIDAAELIGPHDDMTAGLHKTARFYYYPGWHEPGTILDFGFNKKAYDALPADLRRMLDHATAAVQAYGSADFHAKNALALERLRTEFKGKVEILALPAPVLRELKKLSLEVVREQSEKTPLARKVHASFTKFQALIGPWDHVAEGAYHQLIAGTT